MLRQERGHANFLILRVSDQYGSKTSFLVAVRNLEMIKNISNNFGLLFDHFRVVLYG